MKCVWVPTLILFVVLLKTNKQKNIFIPGTWQVLHLGHLFWVIHFLWSPVLSWCHSNIIFAFSEVFLQYSCLSEGLVQLPQDSFPSASRTSNDQSWQYAQTVCLNAYGDISHVAELIPTHFLRFFPVCLDYRLRQIRTVRCMLQLDLE